MSDINTERGRFLLKARENHPMTQEELAHASMISIKTVRRAEQGIPVSAESLRALCSVLSLNAGDILKNIQANAASYDGSKYRQSNSHTVCLTTGSGNKRFLMSPARVQWPDNAKITMQEKYCSVSKKMRLAYCVFPLIASCIGTSASFNAFHDVSFWGNSMQTGLHIMASVMLVIVCLFCVLSMDAPSWIKGMSIRQKLMDSAVWLHVPAAGVSWLLYFSGAGTMSSIVPVGAAAYAAIHYRYTLQRQMLVQANRTRQSSYMAYVQCARKTLRELPEILRLERSSSRIYAATEILNQLAVKAAACRCVYVMEPFGYMIEDMKSGISDQNRLTDYLNAGETLLRGVVPPWVNPVVMYDYRESTCDLSADAEYKRKASGQSEEGFFRALSERDREDYRVVVCRLRERVSAIRAG